MAREFPRFLYSDPKNTKSPGPFILHMLPPIKLFKVIWVDDDKFTLTELAFGDSCSEEKISDLFDDVSNWLIVQIKTGNISIK